MSKIGIPLEGFAKAAGEAAKEGAVLLKNENKVLPVLADEKVSVFGRCQVDYYRSGTGSGGSVNVAYTTDLLGSMREKSPKVVNEELAGLYEAWISENPFDNGNEYWASEPWNQKEMPITEEVVRQAKSVSDKAVIIIGRTAGEEKDNSDVAGSLKLTEDEEKLISLVAKYFDKTALLINTSSILNMEFLTDGQIGQDIKAVMYVWHGGVEGGSAAADLILGNAVPSGKLPDTIAYRIADYPSTPYYGNEQKNAYVEDIYVGYRYFETFHPEQVMYEFGYGLSYTEFTVTVKQAELKGQNIEIMAEVKNTGSEYAGKEVVQVYYEAPQGKLGQPAKQLAAFAKTGILIPGATEMLILSVPVTVMASYDDSGITGKKSAYVLEAGDYNLYVGNSVRNVQKAYTYTVDALKVVEQLEEALAPTEAFERIRPGMKKENGVYEINYEAVPTRTVSLSERISANLPEAILQTGNKGIHLRDVQQGKASLKDFVGQLGDAELAMLVRGEGMGHSDATLGTASAFGGVSDSLLDYGIPLACTADGPSGIRMDGGLQATQVPIGTLLAATWNDKMIEELYILEGQELNRNEIDLLLGPGLNIHRNPMNGRNFEYFSEDPFLTGRMATAIVKGIASVGACATPKHFACNNQEIARMEADSIVSERAAREIYLKGFEMAVKEGKAKAIMTSYNPVNGHWSASNYELNTVILKKEWGFDGFVMTDWWAKMNDVVDGGEANLKKMRDMVRAGNDVYMVVNNFGAQVNAHGDDIMDSLAAGRLTVGELQRSAMNICGFLMNTKAMERGRKIITIPGLSDVKFAEAAEIVKVGESEQSQVSVVMEEDIYIKVEKSGMYTVFAYFMSTNGVLAPASALLVINDEKVSLILTRGLEGKASSQKVCRMKLEEGIYCVRVEEMKPNMKVSLLGFHFGGMIFK